MNEETLMYEYPIEQEKEEKEEEYEQFLKQKPHFQKQFIIFFVAVIVLFALYFVPALAEWDTVILILTVIAAVFFSIGLGRYLNNPMANFLEIKATDERMCLKYFTPNGIKTLNVNYDDITYARFVDNDYTSFEIGFVESAESFSKTKLANGSESYTNNGLFLFRIQPYSYEQYFFMFVAEEFFTVKKFYKTKKFFKKYGNKQEYMDALEGDETVWRKSRLEKLIRTRLKK